MISSGRQVLLLNGIGSKALPLRSAASTSLLSRPISTLKLSDRYLTVHFDQSVVAGQQRGQKEESRFHYIWLRDHSPQAIDQNSGQKLHSAANLPLDVAPTNAEIVEKGAKLKIDWSDKHQSLFDLQWLRDHAYPNAHNSRFPSSSKPKLWLRQDLPNLEVAYEEYMNPNDKGLKKFLGLLHDYGLAFVKGAPTNEDEVGKVATRFGLLRETLYGRLWDVKSVPKAKNIAYTSLPLHFHEDLLYFEAPPGIQLLHSLKNSATGGETLFLDGFKAVEILKEQDPEAYSVLCRVPVTFHYRAGENHRHYRHTTIVEDGENEYQRIYYSPQFQGPLDVPFEDVEKFYRSFATFSKILVDPSLTLAAKLMPGDVAVFNNRRILHARNTFDPNSGERHLKGAYVDLDEFRSTWRQLLEKKI